MWIGCGYPKSGTVWLCKLLGSYLGVPYPQNYALPIAMSSVIHAHWDYHPGLPRVAYIQRDGRDVMTSLYFYNMKAIVEPRHPRHVGKLKERYKRAFGAGFDPADVLGNMPRFIEMEMQHPTAVRTSWPDHMRDWLDGERDNVSYVTYEDLVADPIGSLKTLVESLTDEPGDPEKLRLSVDRFEFARNAGRKPGVEDRSSFLRKGVVGDWRTHFTREAGEVFDGLAGEVLLDVGYVTDRQWYADLATR